MVHVLLLREPSRNSADRYETCLTAQGYTPHSIPVLETALTNLDGLERVIGAGAAYDGVVVTSARACEAWRHVVGTLHSSSSLSGSSSHSQADWSRTPFYAVGEATASALADIHTTYDSPLAPKDIRGHTESGTSERLARFILQDLTHEGRKRLLCLTGDKNRDTLSEILTAGGVQLENLRVYHTKGCESFESNLDRVVGGELIASREWWIVYFAPSAASFVTPILRRVFELPSTDIPSECAVRVAAIGPTTASFLRETLQVEVAVVPARSAPEELVAAIMQYDRQTLEAMK